MERGSKSSAKAQPEDVRVEPTVPGVQPEALMELCEEERTEWYKFTNRMPPDWFPPETWPLLAQLCRHVCQSRFFGQCLQEVRAGLLDPTDDEALERVERLVKLHDREGRALTALMVRLRLTTQQRIPDEDVARRARKARAELPDVQPWASDARPALTQ
jgi:hypothetical protein